MLTTPFYLDGLTASAYHAAPGWSSSQIRLLPDEPLTLRDRHTCAKCGWDLGNCGCEVPLYEPHKETDAMKLGTAVHRVLLDGANIEVIPSEYLTKTGRLPVGEKTKAALAEWEADNPKTVHVLCENSPVHRMVESVRTHPIAGPMLSDPEAIRERSIWWVDDETGLLCKARIDLWLPSLGHMPDLKTTKSPREGVRDFGGEIAAYQLDRQVAWYVEGAQKVGMAVESTGFIAVGSSPPYECWRHPMTMPDENLDRAYDRNIDARKNLKERLDSGDWFPVGYAEEHEVVLPDWYLRKHG